MDIREFDGERLLNSENLQDNIVGVLAGLSDQRAAVRRVLQRIAESDTKDRPAALAELMVLAGLRKLNSLIEEEVRHMPILDDIMDDEVLGRERKLGIAMGLERGLEKGLEQGLQRGLKEARNEEERVLLQLIEKRFKELPGWAVKKVNGMTASEIREATIRLLDAPTLEDLLR